MTDEEFNALSAEDQAAILAHREQAASRVTEAIETLNRLVDTAAAGGNATGAEKMREQIQGLVRKRDEILSGAR